jgi:hypothetical protein
VLFLYIIDVCPVSSGIMERHEGMIGVTSTGVSGEGCVFFIELAVSDWTPVPVKRFSISSTASFQSEEDGGNSLESSSKPLLPATSSFQVESGSAAQTPTPHHKFRNSLYAPLDDEETGTCKVWRALIVDDSQLNVKMSRRVLKPYFDELLEVSDCVCVTYLFCVYVFLCH